MIMLKDGMNNYELPEGWSEFSEKWKRWKNSPYQVSNMGRVRRNGEIRKPRDDDRGHFRVNLTWNGMREEPKLHHMVMELFGPPKPKGDNVVVMHKNNNGKDNRLSNLKWGTTAENTKEAYKDGLIDR